MKLRESRYDQYLPEIRAIYDGSTASVKKLMVAFGFSETWVYEYLFRRGLSKKRVYEHRWTKHRDNMLIELLGKYNRATTAAKLGVTEKAVRSRIRRLHLTEQSCRADWYNLTEVALILDMAPETLLSRITSNKLDDTAC